MEGAPGVELEGAGFEGMAGVSGFVGHGFGGFGICLFWGFRVLGVGREIGKEGMQVWWCFERFLRGRRKVKQR